MKVLIVDDEKPVRDGIKLLINWEEYHINTIFEAEDGHEAVHLIQEELPDLVLTDIMMPVSGGLQLMEWIYQNHIDCKVIAISGYPDYEYIRQIFLHGGIDYILKPIQPLKLNTALKNAIAQMEMEQINTSLLTPKQVFEDTDSVFYQIKYYIDENFSSDLSLNSIASRFYLSEAHISRTFKKLFHMNIIQYIKIVRLTHAKKYLIQTGKPIAEIARLVGYNDEKYFSRVFKENEKMSANDYRQKHQFINK